MPILKCLACKNRLRKGDTSFYREGVLECTNWECGKTYWNTEIVKGLPNKVGLVQKLAAQ